MPPRITKIVPPKFQGLALGLEFGMLAYTTFELSRVYRGTHPGLSRRLAEAGVWPPPRLRATKETGDGLGEGQAKEEDMRWLSIHGLPVPTSFEALTGFWRR
jgi:hypothetical protein